MTKILCAIPCGEMINVRCVKSIYEMTVPEGIDLTIDFFSGYSCPQARNKAACRLVDDKFDYILYIDSDQIVPKDVIARLLACNCEIAAGWAVSSANRANTNICIYDEAEMKYSLYAIADKPTGIVDVDAMGFAAILIKAFVFQTMEYPYFRHIEYGNRMELSEDLYFCNEAKKKNLRIVCDADLKIEHLKSVLL